MADKKAKSSTKKTTTNKTAKTTTVKATTATKPMMGFAEMCKSVIKNPIFSSSIAEFVGTFLLVTTTLSLTVGGGAILVGFALVAIVLLVGGVSGAHLNPAISLGAWVTKKISALRLLGYIAAQAIGGLAAWAVLNAYPHFRAANFATGDREVNLLHISPITADKEWYIFLAELLGVVILSFGVATALRYIHRNKTAASLAMGFTLFMALTIAGSLTALIVSASNASLIFLNPVIAFAATGITWTMWPIAIYVLAPAVGGIIGFALQDYLHSQSETCDCDDCDCK